MDGLRSLARGRRADTPLLLFFGVNAVLLVLAGLITLIVLLVLWLM
jgi:hypothetical protein